MALWKAYDCSSSRDLPLKDIGEIDILLTIAQHNKLGIMGIVIDGARPNTLTSNCYIHVATNISAVGSLYVYALYHDYDMSIVK